MTDERASQSTALAPAAPAPPGLLTGSDAAGRLAVAQDIARALAPVIDRRHLYAVVNGRKYVLFEGWTALGALLGVVPVTAWTRRVERGWEARVEARTLAGAVVGAAEAECLRTERAWATRDDYALRSMAQTRAGAKALRMALGFIIALAGYEATPAEEMLASDDTHSGPQARQVPLPRARQTQYDLKREDPEHGAR